MSLALVHARATTLELLRYPAYVVPTVGFPALFFLFFASGASGVLASYALCSFAAFAMIGVAFFQFGVGIAVERASPWEAYMRTLPVSAAARIGGRLASAAVFGTASVAFVVAAALATTDAALGLRDWLVLLLVLAVGIVPFGLCGIALGYWTSPRAALPVANVLYLLLAYGGGLWIPPWRLPAAVAAVSPFLPTRRLANLLHGVVAGTPWAWRDWLILLAFAAVFAVAAVAGYRNDEGQRFR